jgi:aryl-alcohol dehydrogenase-like predicted oxidoreductase
MAPQPILTTPDGTPISGYCFGTMQFGGKADADESRAMYDACRGAGINFFDTAYGYTEGASETLLGQFANPEREKLFIATKCAHPGDSKADTITRQFDESRQRLGMDIVDLLYLHRWDDDTPLEETFGALAKMSEAGTIRHIGVSNFSAWQVMKAARVAHDFSLSITMLQPMYNLVKRQAEVEILPMAQAEGFAVVPYSPLGGGLLTGKYGAGATGRITDDPMYKARYGQDWMHAAAASLSDFAAELGVSPITLAVAWVARNPGITAPIVSGSSAAQLQPSLAAMTFDMDDDLYARITALTPTPPPATDRTEEV